MRAILLVVLSFTLIWCCHSALAADNSTKTYKDLLEEYETTGSYQILNTAFFTARGHWGPPATERLLHMLQVMAVTRQSFDPNFNPFDGPTMDVAPPLGSGLPSGVAPSAIHDPSVRQTYEDAIASNKSKAIYFNKQVKIRSDYDIFVRFTLGFMDDELSDIKPSGLKAIMEQVSALDMVKSEILSDLTPEQLTQGISVRITNRGFLVGVFIQNNSASVRQLKNQGDRCLLFKLLYTDSDGTLKIIKDDPIIKNENLPGFVYIAPGDTYYSVQSLDKVEWTLIQLHPVTCILEVRDPSTTHVVTLQTIPRILIAK